MTYTKHGTIHTRIYDHNNRGLNVKRKHKKEKMDDVRYHYIRKEKMIERLEYIIYPI